MDLQMRKLILPVFTMLLMVMLAGVVSGAPALPSATPGKPSPISMETIDIRLVTFSPLNDLFAWFGHSAIEIRNRTTGKSHMFNFGGFFFDAEHLVQFAFGKFVFWSFAGESAQALLPYERERRHIVFQTLNLTGAQKTEIVRTLLNYQKPENRFYVYEHFLDNCSTKIRDIIDQALDGDLKKQSSQTDELTFRDYVHRMTYQVPVLDFVLMFVLNDAVDKPITRWDSMFLPDRLLVVVQTSINPLAALSAENRLETERVERNIGPGKPYFALKATAINTMSRELASGFFLLVIIGFCTIFYLKNTPFFRGIYPGVVSAFGLVFGLLGLLLFFMMCFTEHKDTFWNENILLLNPITLLLFPTGVAALFGKLKAAFSWISILSGLSALAAGILKVLPAFDQANGQQLRILLPAFLAIGITGLVDQKIRNLSPRGN
jgi:hypothetical protein